MTYYRSGNTCAKEIKKIVSEKLFLNDFDCVRLKSKYECSKSTIRIDEIVIYRESIGLNKCAKTTFSTKREIIIRDDLICQYCEKKLEKQNMVFEHVIPESRGGHAESSNIVLACTSCNRKKNYQVWIPKNINLIIQEDAAWGGLILKMVETKETHKHICEFIKNNPDYAETRRKAKYNKQYSSFSLKEVSPEIKLMLPQYFAKTQKRFTKPISDFQIVKDFCKESGMTRTQLSMIAIQYLTQQENIS